jgi:hypothetical protein
MVVGCSEQNAIPSTEGQPKQQVQEVAHPVEQAEELCEALAKKWNAEVLVLEQRSQRTLTMDAQQEFDGIKGKGYVVVLQVLDITKLASDYLIFATSNSHRPVRLRCTKEVAEKIATHLRTTDTFDMPCFAVLCKFTEMSTTYQVETNAFYDGDGEDKATSLL